MPNKRTGRLLGTLEYQIYPRICVILHPDPGAGIEMTGILETFLTYVDFTVVLPRKIGVFCFIAITAANGCVTDLEDRAGDDDHDQNGDISHPTVAWTCHFR